MKNHQIGAAPRFILVVLVATIALGGVAAAESVPLEPFVSEPVPPYIFDGDVRDLPRAEPWRPGDPIVEVPRRQHGPAPENAPEARPPGRDPLVDLQRIESPSTVDPGFGNLLVSVPGVPSGASPPDPVGDVGVDYYIQITNASRFSIYDKSDGTVVAGPTDLGSLGSGVCVGGFGDPVAHYDQLAGRWLMAEFSSSNTLCVYISQTGDPVSGGWLEYQFQTPSFPDYYKFGVWPDAYYMGSNEGGSPPAYAFDRVSMLAGAPATFQRFTVSSLSGFGFQLLLPADNDGGAAPAGAPGILMRHRDTEAHGPAGLPTEDRLEIWAFHVDWAVPGNSALTQLPDIVVSEFDSDLCGLNNFSCFDQPGGGGNLDPVQQPLMHRLQYRSFAGHEAIVGSFTTDVDGSDHGGVRWFEIRRSEPEGGDWSLFQEGTYSLDDADRWMSSIAMDGSGNIALGFDIVDEGPANIFASLRYAGRLAGDPLGTLPQGEYELATGGGVNGSSRYGDYAAMGVDPVDDCTFWFTGEYNPTSSYSTRIAAFRFAACGGSGSDDIFADDFETGDISLWDETGTER